MFVRWSTAAVIAAALAVAPAHADAVADFYKRSNALIGTKRRIEGVSLRATDADWRHGS